MTKPQPGATMVERPRSMTVDGEKVPREHVDPCAHDAPIVTAAPYDWRISPKHLQDRDNYFTELKRQIETLYKYVRWLGS